MRQIAASELKAKLLAILDEIAATGQTITVLKRGKPVARIGPATAATEDHPQDTLAGTCRIVGDVTAPIVAEDDVDVLRASR